MIKDTKDFKAKNFGCNHCYANQTKQELIDTIQELKDATKCDIFIIGAYRCKIHHKNIGDAKTLYSKGLAVDIRMADSKGSLLTGQQMIDIIDQFDILDDAKVVIHNTFIGIELGGDYERDYQI